ncbi:MAG TPA: MFS transporter [Enteractinococcus sp.]
MQSWIPQRRPCPRQTEIGERRRLAVMLAMSLGSFAIGTTEFVSMGLLSTIADDFQISENAAGVIITAYALGVVVGAPLIAVFTGLMPRRRLLLLLMAAFMLGNALTVLANTYEALILSRFIAGLPHGAYFSVAALSAASMAPVSERGRAVAFITMGLSVATVLGVPAAEMLGTALGWSAAYALVVVLALVTIVLLWFLMPHMVRMQPTRPRTELSALTRSQVWFTLAIGTVGSGGMFAIYTYISWTMIEGAGLDPNWMWLVLMTYGVGSVGGNWFGGRIADRNLEWGVLFALVMIAVVLVVFYFTSTHPVLGVLTFGVCGFFGTALAPTLQVRLMEVAHDAQTLAAALNHAALNSANAAGAAIGGAVIAAGFSYSAPALAGVVLVLAGIVIWVPAYLLRRRSAHHVTV